jgi:hypothetical protein
MPQAYEFTKRDRASIVKGYKKKSMAELAESYEVSIAVIRRVLIEEGVEIRPRGGRVK